ncbi:thioredoxin-related transmembrane protein 1-like isoform X2 [Patagioenas fasciata]|uniref:thioredoxin-related transmembrane protein 1-like isoform X2 n=1 Tax=Patagioenas fasciata TaxID=372321 RepID=UPI003A99599A
MGRAVRAALCSGLLCCFLALAAGSAALGKRSLVKLLSDGMWQELLQGEWMVEFYAPWCPACQSLQPEWEKFAEWGEDLEVNVAKVDVMEQPDSFHCATGGKGLSSCVMPSCLLR